MSASAATNAAACASLMSERLAVLTRPTSCAFLSRRPAVRLVGNDMDETTCRICSSGSFRGDVVPIFGGEGRRANLQFKIRKYLYLTISADDKLPQVVCVNCCKKLDAIHRFATMAFKIQSRFKELLDLNEKRTDNPNRCTGLLHSYLMKGKVQRREPTESADVTEMEVRVDPTLFLQCLVEEGGADDGGDDDLTEEDSRSSSPQPTMFSRTEQRLIDLVATSVGHSMIPSDTEITLSDPIRPVKVRAADGPSSFDGATSAERTDDVATSARRICRSDCASEAAPTRESRRPPTFGGDVPSRPVRSSDDDDDGDDGCSLLYDCRKDGRTDPHHEYACPVCGKRISTKGNLKVHLETHRPKGKYECNICARIFKTESNLEKHKGYHGGVRFPCGVCGRVYPTNSTLRAHSITHSDLRPHKCSLCNKTFKRNQDLKFHVNQHTGARPYRCSYCPKAFASSGNCFSHRKRMHPQEVERDRERATDVV